MIRLDDELALEFLADCRDSLGAAETGLLSMKAGAPMDEAQIESILRSVRAVQNGAVFFNLTPVRDLAQRMVHALELMRAGKIAPTPERGRVLLAAADQLQQMTRHPAEDDQADGAALEKTLTEICPAGTTASGGRAAADCRAPRRLRALLVEDDFTSRLVLQTFLSRYGECHVAVNGREAVEAVRGALERQEHYDLICMDIMMPEVNGRDAVRLVRALEAEKGIFSTGGAKIVMTTAVDDIKEVTSCFKELCDAYLIKPIDLGKLLGHMRHFELVP